MIHRMMDGATPSSGSAPVLPSVAAGAALAPSDLATAQRSVSTILAPDDLTLLFEPIRVGGVIIPNRFAMSAMGTRFATEEGQVTDRQIAYYRRRARGGVGAVIVEGSSVDPTGTTYLCKPRLYDDKFLPGLERLAMAIKSEGAVPGIQIMHSGRHASPVARVGPALSPSGGGSKVHTTGSQAISERDIRRVIESFGRAAARARRAGFEVIEIHGAHGYLLHDFLSQLSNHRTDAWGGDLLSRARFLMEVIRSVKASVDARTGVIVRLSCSEFIEGGITPDDCAHTAVLAQEAGADLVLVSGGNNETLEWIVPPVFMPLGVYLEQAAWVKRLLTIPVGVVGRMSTPEIAAQAVRNGSADIVFMGRALLADPDFVVKVKRVERRPIRPCIACNECLAQHYRDQPILCTVNPAAGREIEELEFRLPTTNSRRITVVGAGPAGLLFASIAASRGHSVTLVDRRRRLGGKLWLAAAAPYKTREMLALYSSLEWEVREQGVRLRLGPYDNLETLLTELDTELAVVASGAMPVPYSDLEWEPGTEILQAEDYLDMAQPPSWPRVAIIGAGDTACDAAARLARAGSHVWMLARGNRMARGLEPVSARALRRYLADLKVKVLYDVRATALAPGRLDYVDAEGTAQRLDVDIVLYSRGVRPTGSDITSQLSGHIETITIGDAQDPGNFLTSMRSAWELAHRV